MNAHPYLVRGGERNRALEGCRKSFDRFSFPRSSVGTLNRDDGASGRAPTLEHGTSKDK